MLKWCNPVHKKMAFTAKDTQLFPSCKKNQKKNHGHTYEPLDSSFRKKVDTVAWVYFSQQKFYKKPRDPSIFYPQELEKESILETMQISTWKKSVKIVLQDLTSENSLLIEENKKKMQKLYLH